jgi:guanine deaminase
MAADYDCHVQTHCSESDWEHGYVIDRLGDTDTMSLDRFGLLTRHTVLAHGNLITGRDMDAIADLGAGIAHCPLSNTYFANSVFPLRRALAKGVRVGLGTDISGGPAASMFANCRYAVSASRMLHDGVDPARPAIDRGRPESRIDFIDAFWLATCGGADVLNIPVGRFEPGYQFDAMLIDTRVEHSDIQVFEDLDSPEDVFQKIVYGATRANIYKVWVDGRRINASTQHS